MGAVASAGLGWLCHNDAGAAAEAKAGVATKTESRKGRGSVRPKSSEVGAFTFRAPLTVSVSVPARRGGGAGRPLLVGVVGGGGVVEEDDEEGMMVMLGYYGYYSQQRPQQRL